MVHYTDYIIRLKYVGTGKMPDYLKKEKGIGKNPPVIIAGTSWGDAERQLTLPHTLKVRSIKRRGCPHGKLYNIPKKKCLEKPS